MEINSAVIVPTRQHLARARLYVTKQTDDKIMGRVRTSIIDEVAVLLLSPTQSYSHDPEVHGTAQLLAACVEATVIANNVNVNDNISYGCKVMSVVEPEN